MTRNERGLELFKEWKKSGMTQKQFLSMLPKEDSFGSMAITFEKGRSMYDRLLREQRHDEEQLKREDEQLSKDILKELSLLRADFEKFFDKLEDKA